MIERERDIEKTLKREMKNLGGMTYKFVSPGNDGVPDRLVVWPDGHIGFVELKTTTGTVSPIQQVQIDRLRGMGCDVAVVYGKSGVYGYLQDRLQHASFVNTGDEA